MCIHVYLVIPLMMTQLNMRLNLLLNLCFKVEMERNSAQLVQVSLQINSKISVAFNYNFLSRQNRIKEFENQSMR